MLSILLLALWSAPNQDPSVNEQMTIHHQGVVIRALDENRQPVKGLKKEHFKILADGKPLDNFTLLEQDFQVEDQEESRGVADESPQSEAALRTTALFVDATFMRYKMFKNTGRALNQIIDGLGPNQLVRIYHGDKTLRALTPFTRDKEILRKAVSDMQHKPYFQERLHDIEFEIRLANQEYFDGDRGLKDDMRRWTARQQVNHNRRLREQLFEGQFKTQAGYLRSIRNDLKRHQNARSIFMFTGGGVTNQRYLQSFNKAAMALNHSEIPVNIISFNRPPLKGLDNSELPGAFNTVSEMSSNAYAYAKETGGEIVQVDKRKNLKKLVSRVVTAASHQYLLSFQSGEAVKTVKPTYVGPKKNITLTFAKHPGRKRDLAEQDAEPIDNFETQLVYGNTSETLRASWQSRLFRDREDHYRIAVFGALERPNSKSGYQIGFAAFNAKDQPLDIRTADSKQLNGAFRDLLICDQRPAKIRYAVRDLSNQMTTIHEEVLPPLEAAGFQLSDVVLGRPRDTGSLPLHFQKDQTTDNRRRLDPFLVDGKLLSANSFNSFKQAETLTAFFFLEHLEAPLNSYQLSCRAESGEHAYDLTIKPVIVKQLDESTVQILAEVDVSTVPLRAYQLVVTAEGNGKSSSRSQAINPNVL